MIDMNPSILLVPTQLQLQASHYQLFYLLPITACLTSRAQPIGTGKQARDSSRQGLQKHTMTNLFTIISCEERNRLDCESISQKAHLIRKFIVEKGMNEQ